LPQWEVMCWGQTHIKMHILGAHDEPVNLLAWRHPRTFGTESPPVVSERVRASESPICRLIATPGPVVSGAKNFPTFSLPHPMH